MKNMKHDKEKTPLSKKLKVIIPIAAAAVIAVAVAVILFACNNSKEEKYHAKISEDIIIKDLNKQKDITQIKVGKKTEEFKVSDVDVVKGSEVETDDSYSFKADVTRKNDSYSIAPVKYTVKYSVKDSDYSFVSAKAGKKAEIVLSPLKGVDSKTALKKAAKLYKSAEYKSSDTDLEKGTDVLNFKVDDKECEGTLTLKYKFNSTKGWIFKSYSDKNVSFKKGVTHRNKDGLLENSNVKNVLFLGIDSNDGVGRSDCMMLISIDSNTGKIKQTSFMRDNWFNIPGWGYSKLNAAYAFDGPALTLKTLQGTFGVKIDNYVAVSFSTFRDVINALGGIDVKIDSDEAGYINWQIQKNGQTSYVGLVDGSGGVVHLNGQQALWLCRDRGNEYFSGDDFVRTSRQRRVIQSISKTYKTLTPDKVLTLLMTLKGHVKTNLTADDLKWYAKYSSKFFTYGFKERCVPEDGEWQAGYSDDGQWIIQLNDFEGLKKDIQKHIFDDLK